MTDMTLTELTAELTELFDASPAPLARLSTAIAADPKLAVEVMTLVCHLREVDASAGLVLMLEAFAAAEGVDDQTLHDIPALARERNRTAAVMLEAFGLHFDEVRDSAARMTERFADQLADDPTKH